MPDNTCYKITPKALETFRKALHTHFKGRGIPEYRFSDLTWRWIKQKGYRVPNAA